MSAPAANVSVWMGERLVCVKITGRANFTCSVDFKALMHRLWDKGQRRFVLDLTDCLLMDSTFLGVLAGFSQKLTTPGNAGPTGCLELVNANPRILDLLENLGIAHLFKLVQHAPVSTDQMQAVAQKPSDPDRKEVTKLCLEAHETLMAINPANVSKFKDVAKFLAEDLQK